MCVENIIMCVSIAVAHLLQIPSVQCFFIESLNETLITSGKLHYNESTNSSLQENIIAYKITPNNFAGQMSNNTLNTLYNSSITNNSSIQDVKNSHDIELDNFIGKTDYDHDLVTKNDSSLCRSCTCGKNNQRRRKRISGGVTAEQTEFPWMAALIVHNKSSGDIFYWCGAMVITERHLLTASHCVVGLSAEELRAWLGSNNLQLNDSYRVVKHVEKIIQYPEFNATGLLNDIAIVKLDSPISFNTSYIQPACLPQFENRNYTGLIAVASGWGGSGQDPGMSFVLRKVELLVGDCRKKFEHDYIDDIICSYSNPEQKDTCPGDSGGPLHIHDARSGTTEVIGITAGGTNCTVDSSGFYTRIDIFMPWINKTINGECLCHV